MRNTALGFDNGYRFEQGKDVDCRRRCDPNSAITGVTAYGDNEMSVIKTCPKVEKMWLLSLSKIAETLMVEHMKEEIENGVKFIL